MAGFLFHSEAFQLLFLKSIKGLRHHVLTLHLSDKKINIEGQSLLFNYVPSVVKLKMSKRKMISYLAAQAWPKGDCVLWCSHLNRKSDSQFFRITYTDFHVITRL